MKSAIIQQLGQTDILLPSLIADGLAANDSVKVRLSATCNQHGPVPAFLHSALR